MLVAAHPTPPPSPTWLIAFLVVGAFAGRWLFHARRERGIMLRCTLYSGILAMGAVLAVGAYVAAYQHLAAVPGVPGSGWVLNWLIAWLIVGIFAGALAGTVTQEGAYDLVGDIITGIIGALIGGLVGLAPGWHTFVDVILKAFIGACLLSGLKIALVYAVRGTRPHLHGRLRKARPKLEDSSMDKTLGVSPSPAPAARPWWQRHPYLISLVPALVILTVCVAAHDVVMDASNGTPTGFAGTINIVASAGVLVLYGVLVAAALVSLAMPRLRHSYARGLWTAVLLIPFILVAAVGMGLVAFGGD